MFSLPKFAIKRPMCILICVISLIVFGLSSVLDMPLESTPEMEMPILMVMTSYYGASPEEIDQMVTDRIETALDTISEVDTVQSISSEGMSMVMMQFDYSADMDKKFNDVTSALSFIGLPDDCSDPVIMELNINNMMNSSIISLSIRGQASNNIKNYVEDNIVPELERIEGVSDVSIYGGSSEYIQVLLDENKLTQYHLTMAQVAAAIGSAEYEITLGNLDRGDVTTSLVGSHSIDTYYDIANVQIPLASGDIIHVSDIAQVNMASEEPDSYSRRDGLETITLSVAKEQSANTVNICKKVVNLVNQLNDSNLGLEISVVFNSGETIMDTIMSVFKALLEGMIIAMVILWLFLGDWKASAIVGISMPLSVLTALIAMAAFGMTINVISLGGLVIGIGMLVDNSIVVIDSCFKSQVETLSLQENVIRGANFVVGAVVASTLTTIVVFLPIALLDGISGQLFHDICYTIVFSLVASLVSAITLVPLLFVRLKPVERTEFFVNRAVRKLEAKYGILMHKLLDRRSLVVIVALLIFVSSLLMFSMIDMEFIPDMTGSSINMTVETKNGMNLESNNEIVLQIEDILKAEPDVETYSVNVGTGSGMTALLSGGSSSISITLKDDASMSQDEFIQYIRDKTADIPNCYIDVSSSSIMSTMSGSSVEITLNGKNLNDIRALSEEIRTRMSAMEEFDYVSSSMSDGSPRTKITVDPILSGAVGMTPATVLADARNKLSGMTAMEIQDGGTEYSVIVEYPTSRYQDVSDLYGLMIDTPSGGKVTLTDIASIEYSTAPASLIRTDGEYTVSVTGTPKVGMNVNSLTTTVLDRISDLEIPDGITINKGTTLETMMEEFAAIGKALLTAIFLVFAVMTIQFESMRFSVVVLISIPFALTGSFFGLLLCGSSINSASLLGVVMLAGIVVNNAIVLIDYVNILRREEGLEIREALITAGRSRLRPILMSTLTTVCSLIPVAIVSDVEMMESMAIVVIGGLTLSTLLTLILIPTFYLIFDKDDRKNRKDLKKQRRLEKRMHRTEETTAEV